MTEKLGKLVEEVRIWNTPIVGAFLLWKFTQGYLKAHPEGDAPVGILHFIAIGILTSELLTKTISNRRDCLQSYVRSFEDNKDSDLLLSIQDRILQKREYTLKSIDIAISKGMLIWDAENGKLYPCEIKNRASKGNALKRKIKSEGEKAEILGKWFAKHDITTIAAYLKVII